MAQRNADLTIQAATTITSNGTSPNPVSVEAYEEVLVVIATTAVSGTGPNLSVQLQGSVDGLNWVNVGVPATVTAAGVTSISLPRTSPIGKLLQAAYTVTGTNPSLTFSILGHAKGN